MKQPQIMLDWQSMIVSRLSFDLSGWDRVHVDWRMEPHTHSLLSEQIFSVPGYERYHLPYVHISIWGICWWVPSEHFRSRFSHDPRAIKECRAYFTSETCWSDISFNRVGAHFGASLSDDRNSVRRRCAWFYLCSLTWLKSSARDTCLSDFSNLQ